jgi:dihydroorotate dehydrogenase (fumarate)/dihydroorotate dehydrogenase
MRIYERLVRPVLFGLPSEPAHQFAKLALRMFPARRMAAVYEVHSPRLRTQLAGLPLARPVGLAAGFDKDGDVIDPLQCLGFGYVVVGSVMPRPRRGNPKPRIVRYAKERSLVNCLGLPSKGLAHATARLQARRIHRVPIVANVHGSTVDEFAGCVRALEPYVDAIEVSLICPNVDDPALEFLEPAGFQRLWRALGRRARRPLLLKLPSYETPAERSMRLELVDLALHLGVAGFTISGTFMRPELGLSMGRGNVSGAPARERALGFVRDLYSVVGRKADIKALGGISSGRDAFDAIAAGATTAELLTGLIYRGPGVAREVNRSLAHLMARHGVPSVDELRGREVAASDASTGCGDVEI